MIGESAAFRSMLQLAVKVARFDEPVLIDGETGTGKELVARAIHSGGPRRGRPFVALNCGAIPESLIENELFGHRRGAFTDAHDDRPGVVALADTGTLFLDEIDALPPKGQATLLRFLQDRLYRPLGDRRETRADVRVIAATNRDLSLLSERGAFRKDLLYRLRFFDVRVPALRERDGDVRLLSDHFLAVAATKYQKAERPLAPETMAWFHRHEWPGNVRELENLVSREFLLCEDDAVQIPAPAAREEIREGTLKDLPYREAKANAIARFEAEYLRSALERAGGNVTAAARLIGTERRHLGHLLKRYRIPRRPDPSRSPMS
jgi:two-component system response regulator GlrR